MACQQSARRAPVDLDVTWVHGAPQAAPDPGPPIQVHPAAPGTYLLRQNKSTHYEAPFMVLLIGRERALLLDTGASCDPEVFPLRATVDQLLAAEGQAQPDGAELHLVVAHTHAHADHVAADAQFGDRAATTVVGTDLASVRHFWGLDEDLERSARLDLGERVLEVLSIPGHHATCIAVFDPWTGLLLTGDTVYPGRLYAPDMPAFVAGLDRLVRFAQARPVTHVIGCHIEMTRSPGRDYPVGTTYQPDEPALQMTVEQLVQVRDAAHAVRDEPGVHVFDTFIIDSSPRAGG